MTQMGQRRLVPAEPSLCEVGGRGTVILPLFGDVEHRWPSGLRIVLYFLGLAWCFFGVAIISDIFMGAIEHITSKRVRKRHSKTGKVTTALVWNPTVANLTLMALGSSAPEILLNVVETTLMNDMYSGDLGPSTIVGSAAFNLFIIIAVCVSSIPVGEVRKIKDISVYLVTSMFSIFAYLWLLFVLMVASPNVVEVWEGVFTFLFFPVLVTLAWCADKGFWGSSSAARLVAPADMTKEELAELESTVRKEHGDACSDEHISMIIGMQAMEVSRSRASYRAAATRTMTGGKRLGIGGATGSAPGNRLSKTAKVVPVTEAPEEQVEKCFIELALANIVVFESCGTAKVWVRRRDALDTEAMVRYKTTDGTAKSKAGEDNADYVQTEGTLTFGVNETEKVIEVEILDDSTYEDDEDFFVELFEPILSCEPDSAKRVCVTLLDGITNQEVTRTRCRVTIMDDDQSGTLLWTSEEERVQRGAVNSDVSFQVLRKHGRNGVVNCKYVTENATAIAGVDFIHSEGAVTMDDKQVSAKVSVPITSRQCYGGCHFRIVLSDIEGPGARFDPNTDGGKDTCILTVHIDPDPAMVERVDSLKSKLQMRWDRAKIGHTSWKEQFREAIMVNGGGDDDGDEDEDGASGEASAIDYVLHAVTLPWKFIFAFVPPTDYCGGWLCFCVSLAMIGGVTVLIGDLANLFGCVIPFMTNEITAITFVALGTSLPDTFASRTAALQDPYADASVGNVTGSNSVNVFLGLGLPWMLSSMYWTSKTSDADWDDKFQYDPDLDWLGAAGARSPAFIVKSGALAYSVGVFTCCAFICLGGLAVRRRLYSGELGGPKIAQRVTSFLLASLWLVYIGLSVLKIKDVT